MAEMIPFSDKNDDQNKPSENQAEQSAPEPSSKSRPVYTNEEVSEIVRVALKNLEGDGDNTVDYEEMLAIGRDFGLTENDLEGAFESINKTRSEQELISQAMLWFKLHAMTFAIILGGLFIINMMTMPSYWWFAFPFVGWGMGLALHGVLVRYFPQFAATLSESVADVSLQWAELNQGSRSVNAAAAFTTSDIYEGMAKSSGVAQIQGDELLIEFETRDSVFGILKSGVKEIHVPLNDIATTQLTRQYWSTKITLQSNRLKTFEGFPGHTGGKIQLIFDRNTRAAAERLAAALSKRI